ncbi:hypothetical protein KR074_008594, partial [Drosophila pseudoananassae]
VRLQFVFAVFCLASAAAAPGYLGGLGGPLPLAAAPAISYGHALAGPSIASYGLAPRILSPTLAHAPLAAPAISTYGLGPRILSPSLAHAPLSYAHAPLGLAHAPLAAPLAAPLGLGYKSLVSPALAAPALGLAHGW